MSSDVLTGFLEMLSYAQSEHVMWLFQPISIQLLMQMQKNMKNLDRNLPRVKQIQHQIFLILAMVLLAAVPRSAAVALPLACAVALLHTHQREKLT